jgi:hypothetical protein
MSPLRKQGPRVVEDALDSRFRGNDTVSARNTR